MDYRDWLHEDDVPWGRYAFALEQDGLEVLMDPALFWGPPRVLVRHSGRMIEIWLAEDDVSVTSRSAHLSADLERRSLELVRERLEELEELWFHLRNDAKRGRLSRNVFVD